MNHLRTAYHGKVRTISCSFRFLYRTFANVPERFKGIDSRSIGRETSRVRITPLVSFSFSLSFFFVSLHMRFTTYVSHSLFYF